MPSAPFLMPIRLVIFFYQEIVFPEPQEKIRSKSDPGTRISGYKQPKYCVTLRPHPIRIQWKSRCLQPEIDFPGQICFGFFPMVGRVLERMTLPPQMAPILAPCAINVDCSQLETRMVRGPKRSGNRSNGCRRLPQKIRRIISIRFFWIHSSLKRHSENLRAS